MILTTHALVGAAAGKYIQNPFLLVLILIPLHYAMDNFRHGEYLNVKTPLSVALRRSSIDIAALLTIITVYLLSSQNPSNVAMTILIGAFFSILPDFLTLLHWRFGMPYLGWLYKFHGKMHRYPNFSPERAWTLRNAVNDIIFSVIAIAFLFL